MANRSVNLMYKICTQEYKAFMEEYKKFLHYYTEVERKRVLIKTNAGGGNTEKKALLYKQVVEGHINATNAYIRLVAIYKQMVQKWQEAAEKRL